MGEDSIDLGEREFTVRWPISTGQDVRFAHATAVTLTPLGYVIEFGVLALTGLVGRSKEEIDAIPQPLDIGVVSRVLLPAAAVKDLHRFLTKRLQDDGHIPKPEKPPTDA